MKKAVRVVMAAAGLGILLAGCAKKEPAPETTGTTAETAEETTAEETEEVSRDIFARLSEAPEDAEAQIAVLAREVSTWAPDTEEYAGFWTGCAAADLDHNGRLEIIVSAAGGTGMFTTTRIWEVNEQKDGISEVKWEKEEGDSEGSSLVLAIVLPIIGVIIIVAIALFYINRKRNSSLRSREQIEKFV